VCRCVLPLAVLMFGVLGWAFIWWRRCTSSAHRYNQTEGPDLRYFCAISSWVVYSTLISTLEKSAQKKTFIVIGNGNGRYKCICLLTFCLPALLPQLFKSAVCQFTRREFNMQ